MKQYFAILFLSLVMLMGCDMTHQLDWHQTPQQQQLQVGDTVHGSGICYDVVKYKASSTHEGVWHKVDWAEASKINIRVYNPDGIRGNYGPLAPISIVMCTVYNPNAHKHFKQLAALYPDERIGSTSMEHHIEFTGEIYSLERLESEPFGRFPAAHLNCVHINVASLRVIRSKHANMP